MRPTSAGPIRLTLLNATLFNHVPPEVRVGQTVLVEDKRCLTFATERVRVPTVASVEQFETTVEP